LRGVALLREPASVGPLEPGFDQRERLGYLPACAKASTRSLRPLKNRKLKLDSTASSVVSRWCSYWVATSGS